MNRIQTKAGDIMHVSECNENEATYGLIFIELKNRYKHLKEAEKVLIQFMQQLQPIFAIQHTAGLYIMRNPRQSKLVTVDYWRDVEQKDWKIKGWTNGATINVLYIKNISNVTVAMEDCFFSTAFFAAR